MILRTDDNAFVSASELVEFGLGLELLGRRTGLSAHVLHDAISVTRTIVVLEFLNDVTFRTIKMTSL